MSDELVIEVVESDEHGTWRSLRPLFTCGHYGEPVFDRSSQWDFPHDVFICPECGREVQMDLRLQLLIMSDW